MFKILTTLDVMNVPLLLIWCIKSYFFIVVSSVFELLIALALFTTARYTNMLHKNKRMLTANKTTLTDVQAAKLFHRRLDSSIHARFICHMYL